MPYSCLELCWWVVPCVNLIYSIKIFIKGHVTSPVSDVGPYLKKQTQNTTPHTLRNLYIFTVTHLFISSRQSVAKKKLLIFGWQALKALQSVREKKDWLVFLRVRSGFVRAHVVWVSAHVLDSNFWRHVRDTHNFRLHSMARSILNSGRLMKPSAFSSCRQRQMESGGTASTHRTKCHAYQFYLGY